MFRPMCRTTFRSNIPLLDPQRMTPKSPRAALEPERVAMPTRRSKRAKHPIVIAGNAIFTIILLIALGVGGVVFWSASSDSMRPGPLRGREDRQHPARRRARHCRTCWQREGVIDRPVDLHGRRAGAEGARRGSANTANISSRKQRQHCARWSTRSSRARWSQHQFTLAEGPDLRADRGAAA